MILNRGEFNFRRYFTQNWQAFLILIILVFGVYFNSLGNDFTSDDIPTIKDNPEIKNLSSSLLSYPPFFSPVNLVKSFIYHLVGLNPIGYRIVNIFFHLGSVLTIFILLSFFFNPPLNFFAAGIFAVHPVMVESVAWISGIPYSAAAFFILISFLAYLVSNQKNSKFYFLSLFFFIIALFFSIKTVVFPLVLSLYEFCFEKLKNNWRRLLPFWIASLVMIVMFIVPLKMRSTTLITIHHEELGFENPFIKIPAATTLYLELIFWPKSLTLYHSELNMSVEIYFLRLILSISFLLLIIFFFKRDRDVFFWLSFFLIGLSPILFPYHVASVVAERYVYLDSLGIIIFGVWLILKIGNIVKNQKLSFLILVILLFLLAARTVVRNTDWKNPDTLFLAAAKTSPSSPENHNNLGDLFTRRGEFEKAIQEFKRAIELKPNYGAAYHNLGNVYVLTGKDNLAMENYQKAILFNPTLWQSYQNLAAIYFKIGNLNLAEENLRKAIEINSQNAELHVNLSIVLLKLDKRQGAKEEILKALKLDPQNKKAKQVLSLTE